MPFAATWMDLDDHIKWSKTEKDEYHNDIPYMWNLNKWHKWTYIQNRKRPTDIESKLTVTKGERREEG